MALGTTSGWVPESTLGPGMTRGVIKSGVEGVWNGVTLVTEPHPCVGGGVATFSTTSGTIGRGGGGLGSPCKFHPVLDLGNDPATNIRFVKGVACKVAGITLEKLLP